MSVLRLQPQPHRSCVVKNLDFERGSQDRCAQYRCRYTPYDHDTWPSRVEAAQTGSRGRHVSELRDHNAHNKSRAAVLGSKEIFLSPANTTSGPFEIQETRAPEVKFASG
jgi:hypothetical protein